MKTKKQYDKNDFIMTLLKGRTFIVLIILVVLFSVLSENFFSTSTLLMVAKHVALYGILAIGMTYVVITGGIDLSVGSVVGLGGMIAGYLIQKGLTIGGAQVSPKHANFIVNMGNARAADIRALIEKVQATVLERYGVALEREVIYWGF